MMPPEELARRMLAVIWDLPATVNPLDGGHHE